MIELNIRNEFCNYFLSEPIWFFKIAINITKMFLNQSITNKLSSLKLICLIAYEKLFNCLTTRSLNPNPKNINTLFISLSVNCKSNQKANQIALPLLRTLAKRAISLNISS